jgi:hypothetical protein
MDATNGGAANKQALETSPERLRPLLPQHLADLALGPVALPVQTPMFQLMAPQLVPKQACSPRNSLESPVKLRFSRFVAFT